MFVTSQALVIGQSLAGVATSLLSFLTILGSASSQHGWPTAEDVRPAAVKYFAACALTVLMGLAGYLILPQLHFLQHWTLIQGDMLPLTFLLDACETCCT